MRVVIEKSKFNGKVSAISSKSHAHRALICAALSKSESKIECYNLSKDIEATVNCLNDLGADISYIEKNFIVKPIDVSKAKNKIDVGESGSTLRFLIPIICALGLTIDVKMHGRLPERPLFPLDRELEKNGCKLSKNGDVLSICGKLNAKKIEIEGNVSSQFISGLLFALPLLKSSCEIVIKDKFESYSYVLLTLDVLKQFGIEYKFENNTFKLLSTDYKSTDLVIEGDWSNAAFWLCLGGLLNDGITVENLDFNSVQGDKKIIDILSKFGAKIEFCGNCVKVSKGDLNGIIIDASDIPDLVPILCVVACNANGKTIIKNVQRLRIKESDRIKSVVEMVTNLGGKIEEVDDSIVIYNSQLIGGTVNSYNDHRIAMSASIASVLCKNPVEIINAESVEKSYPLFYNDFEKIGGKVKKYNE